MDGTDWHTGPHPAFGFMTTHVGPKETCSGPDCGPDFEDSDFVEVPMWAVKVLTGPSTIQEESRAREALKSALKEV